MKGASRPTSTMITSTTRATRDDLARRMRRTPSARGDSRGRAGLVSSESWVSPGIEQIGDNASNGHHDAADDHSPYDEGIVASADGVDNCETHSRPGEDLFDEKRAGEESGEGKPEKTDDWKECVAQRVPAEDLALGESFHTGGANLVSGKYVEQRGPLIARHAGSG